MALQENVAKGLACTVFGLGLLYISSDAGSDTFYQMTSISVYGAQHFARLVGVGTTLGGIIGTLYSAARYGCADTSANKDDDDDDEVVIIEDDDYDDDYDERYEPRYRDEPRPRHDYRERGYPRPRMGYAPRRRGLMDRIFRRDDRHYDDR